MLNSLSFDLECLLHNGTILHFMGCFFLFFPPDGEGSGCIMTMLDTQSELDAHI